MLKRAFFAAAFVAFVSSVSSHAASLEEAQTHYDEGRYDAAADMAASLQTADGFVLASKSLIGKTSLSLRKDRSLDEIERATNYADKAIALNPELVSAHLQFSTSLGLRGRLVSKVRAQMEGLPERARVKLERAYELDPDHSWTNAFLAAWHLEIVRNGGATLGKAMYGAELEIGFPMYDRALTLEPKSPVLPYEYAQFVLALDYWAYRERASELLQMSLDVEAKNHQERAIHGRVEDLQAALAADDGKAVLALVAKHLGSKKIRLPRKPRS